MAQLDPAQIFDAKILPNKILPNEILPAQILPETITTARLHLEAPAAIHAHSMAQLANNARVIENLTRLPFPYQLSDAQFFIENLARKNSEWAYSICLAGQCIGVTSFNFTADARGNIVPELGYWLGEPFWGHGYGTEIARAMVDAACQTGKISILRSRVLHTNERSARILQKIGFVIVGQEPEPQGLLKGQNMILLRLDLRP